MGRTNPTFRDTLRNLEDQWSPYRRGLRRRDQDLFDTLWGYARSYADAGGYLNHADPEVVMLFSICVAQQRQIEMLRQRVDGDPAGHDGGAGQEQAPVSLDESEGADGGSHAVQD
jgi:hypothetical protein